MVTRTTLAARASAMRRRGHVYREIAEELGVSEGHAHVLVNGRPKPRRRTLRARRMRLSRFGEIRALARLAANHQPEAAGHWRKYGRCFTLVELANIEIIEPTVRVEQDGPLITVDEDTARQLYALAWERFEKALVETNALYNETPDEGQLYQFNRVKRLLWAVDDLQRNIDAVYRMTAMPDNIEEIDDPS